MATTTARTCFVVQAKGAKDFTLRRTPSTRHRPSTRCRGTCRFEKETSPADRLHADTGDWLYIPRGFWHRAHARDHSLSISIGVLSPAARGTAQRRAWDSLPPQADAAAGGWR
jgi:ribosomal protein L16 Arg81 hydroxylase